MRSLPATGIMAGYAGRLSTLIAVQMDVILTVDDFNQIWSEVSLDAVLEAAPPR